MVAPAAEHLTDRSSPVRQFRPTYGQAQSSYPPRRLTYDEAFISLISAVDASTPIGLGDEVVLRHGLAGVRSHEIAGLLVGDVRGFDGDHPSLH